MACIYIWSLMITLSLSRFLRLRPTTSSPSPPCWAAVSDTLALRALGARGLSDTLPSFTRSGQGCGGLIE